MKARPLPHRALPRENPCLAVICSRHQERGVLNIVTLAAALPLLLLLLAAAAEVMRLPIVKQQLQNSVHIAADSFIFYPRGPDHAPESAAALDWCILRTASASPLLCPRCSEKPSGCSGAEGEAIADEAAHRAAAHLYQALTKKGFGIFSHRPEDLGLTVSVYNVLTTARGSFTGVEETARIDGKARGAPLTTRLSERGQIEQWLRDNWRPELAVSLGAGPQPDKRLAMPLLVISGAVRVHHVFNLRGLIEVVQGEPSQKKGIRNETILYAQNIRALSRPLVLSGRLKNKL